MGGGCGWRGRRSRQINGLTDHSRTSLHSILVALSWRESRFPQVSSVWLFAGQGFGLVTARPTLLPKGILPISLRRRPRSLSVFPWLSAGLGGWIPDRTPASRAVSLKDILRLSMGVCLWCPVHADRLQMWRFLDHVFAWSFQAAGKGHLAGRILQGKF